MSAKGSLFPSDETIYERSKDWANFMSRMIAREDYKSIRYDEIPTDDYDDESESEAELKENGTDNNCLALVKINNFEASSTSEDDMDDLLNETLPDIEERRRKWKESGMDRVLDTFDVNAITDKVGPWLRKSKLQISLPTNSSVEEEQIMHFENHQIHYNSDESLQSTDTAKYILSNRKPRATSCTTMTIKRFRYVKGKQRELEQKYNHFDKFDVNHEIGEVFNRKYVGRLPATQSKISNRAMSEVNVRPKFVSNLQPQIHSKTYEDSLGPSVKNLDKPKPQPVKRQKSLHRKRRSDRSRKRSVSWSSSCSSTADRNSSNPKPKFRKVLRRSKKVNESHPIITLTSSGCELSSEETVVKTNGNVPKQTQAMKASNETCFLPENIVNSTAVSKPNPLVKLKDCLLSPIGSEKITKGLKTPKRVIIAKCKNLFTNQETMEKPMRDEQATTSKENHIKLNSVAESQDSDRKVLLYTPKKTQSPQNVSGGSFKLTEEHLRQAIGKKASRRFLALNRKKFPLEFDSRSTVYYKLPNTMAKSDSTDDSDEDVLDIFAKQGELVAEPTLNP